MELSAIRPLLPNEIIPTESADGGFDEAASAASDFESFLTLLTAQLRNQDPMSPLDSSEFIAQLASFSSVEQQISTNDKLDRVIEQSINGDVSAFSSWIGREVSTTNGEFRATGAPVSFGIERNEAAERISAVVRDQSGLPVRRFDLDTRAQSTFEWDGKNADGAIVEGQELKIEIEYFSGGTLLATKPAIVGSMVTSIRGTPNGVDLDLADGRRVAATDVATLSLIEEAAD